MLIRLATRRDCPAWDAFVTAHPAALAYHRSAWAAAIRQAYGFPAGAYVAEQAGRILGVFPVAWLRTPWGQVNGVSMPYADAGGPLADANATAQALLEAAVRDLRRRGAQRLEVRLLEAAPADFATGEPSSVHKVRMVLDLPDSPDALLKSFKAKLRSQVKKPLRDGLTARTGGRDLVLPFWKIYAHNMRDLGSPPHPLRWFHSVVQFFGPDATVAVVALPDGTPAAAGITLRCGDTVSIPWASSLHHVNRWNPNMLLYWTLLADAIQNGARRFDFGRSTPGEGTHSFKAQWGARERPLYWLSTKGRGWHPVPTQSGTGAFRSQAEQILMRLPVTANAAIGALVRKYLSL